MPLVPFVPSVPFVTFVSLLLQEPHPTAGHQRLDTAMFWVGAMFAFTPILVAIGVGVVVWYHRRKPPGEKPSDRGS